MAQTMSSDRASLPISDRPLPDLVTDIPGPKAKAHVAFDESVTSPSLPRAYPIVPVRGLGAAIEDIDGNLFLDFTAGIAVNSTGHGHPRVVGAIKEQASDLIHYSASDFYLPIYAETAAAIARIAPMSGKLRTYLGNSGAEAVEVAMKLARHYTGRPYIVGFLGGFHGRTYGAVSLTASKAKYHAGFNPLLPGIYHAPYGKVEDLTWFDEVLFDRLVPANEVAAVVIEPIQGEGGYIVPEDGFLQGLRELCTRHGILLIADEIQSGAGRTGKMWAIEHWGIEPDILLAAKGIASGMPLSAMVAPAKIMEHWGVGAHGSTYGGNPVACAAALATIELLEGGLIDNAAERGEQAMAGLRTIQARFPKSVLDVRGKGLMIGIEFADPNLAEEVQLACFKRGLLVLECGKQTVRLCPPLVVSADEVDTAVRIFGEAVEAVATHPKEIARQAAAAGALHDGEVDG
ncbi:MAG TPA: aminotransferase class III-fold pyridoxal phosphate-dependent enzyme [Candidatus Limnocylindrales bacterium]|nr:aminotransferase class III-fold pyridoxal phosphate-dependent enzyme [Candidatus Limnocylindrales bacterium]